MEYVAPDLPSTKDAASEEEKDVGKSEAQVVSENSKESMSAFFTILAAAFGLISDGCMFFCFPGLNIEYY